jgi:predicted RecB family nuclease
MAPPFSLGRRFRAEQGAEIGRRARGLFPGGILIEETDMAAAVRTTRTLRDDAEAEVLFEAAFMADNAAARADILVRNGSAWDLIEVKSAMKPKERHVDDMAYTALVLHKAGVPLRSVLLMHVAKHYRLGMGDDRLFATVDCTPRVFARAGEFSTLLFHIDQITAADTPPPRTLTFACRSCDHFGTCLGNGVEHHIFNLPHLKPPRFDRLLEAGITAIPDIPSGFPLTPTQQRVVACVKARKCYIGSQLRSSLEAIRWPVHYLDFEAVNTAIPLTADTAPYAHIPTQYSVHTCEAPGSAIAHAEYLADPRADWRRDLAGRLIADLEGEGSILIYSPFEKRIVGDLARTFPDLAPPLQADAARMVDLEAIVRKHFYHPAFRGSTSIKRVLPALVPEMSYAGMDIGDGDTAMAAFACLAHGRYTGEEEGTVREQLLAYCAQDTLAMVRLHEALLAYT